MPKALNVFERAGRRRRRPSGRRSAFLSSFGQVEKVIFQGQLHVVDEAGNPIVGAIAEVGEYVQKRDDQDRLINDYDWRPLGPKASTNSQGIVDLVSDRPLSPAFITNTMRAKIDAPGFRCCKNVIKFMQGGMAEAILTPKPAYESGVRVFVEGRFVGETGTANALSAYQAGLNAAGPGERVKVTNEARIAQGYSDDIQNVLIKGPGDTYISPQVSDWPAILGFPKTVISSIALKLEYLLKDPSWVVTYPNDFTFEYGGRDFPLRVMIPVQWKRQFFPTSATNRLYPIPIGIILDAKLDRYKNFSVTDIQEILRLAMEAEVHLTMPSEEALLQAQQRFGLSAQELKTLLGVRDSLGTSYDKPTEAIAKFLEVLRAPNEEERQDLETIRRLVTPVNELVSPWTAVNFEQHPELWIYSGDRFVEAPGRWVLSKSEDSALVCNQKSRINFLDRANFYGIGAATPWGLARTFAQNIFTFEEQVRTYPWPFFGIVEATGLAFIPTAIKGGFVRIFFMGSDGPRKGIQDLVRSAQPITLENAKTFITTSIMENGVALDKADEMSLCLSEVVQEDAERKAKRKARAGIVMSVVTAVISIAVPVLGTGFALALTAGKTFDDINAAKAAAKMAEFASMMSLTDMAFAEEVQRVAELLNAEAARRAATAMAVEEGTPDLASKPFPWIPVIALTAIPVGLLIAIYLLSRK